MDALKSKGQMLDQINLEQIPRSGFDLSYSTKGTGKIGRIIPTRCMECLPSDSIKGSSQAALQFQPLAVPILANMRVKQETWYVPNHILLDNWDTFITKGQDLSDNSVLPSFSLQRFVDSTWFHRLFGYSDALQGESSLIIYVRPAFDRTFFDDKSQEDKLYANMFIEYGGFVKTLNLMLESFSDISNFGGKFEVDDLFDYRLSLLRNYIDSLQDRFGANGESLPTFYSDVTGNIVQYKGVPIFQTNSPNFKGSLISFSDWIDDSSFYHYSSFFDTLDSQLLSLFKERGFVIKGDVYVLSDYLKEFLQLYEDIASYVIGAGSLFDYLGYTTFSPLDFRCNFDLTFSRLYQICFDTMQSSGKYMDRVSQNIWSFLSGDFVSDVQQNILPLRACYAIWYNNYRDKLLETAAPEPSTSSVITDDELFILSLLRIRAWSKDSFNTALANTGTGNMVVPISQNLSGTRTKLSNVDTEAQQLDLNMDGFVLADGTDIDLPTRYLSVNHTQSKTTNNLKYEFSLDTLRRAGRTEKWIQKALIYGNLIQDALFTHWGVKIKNERIQLPEFVTSSVELVKIDTILNNTTISSADDSVQATAGDKAGFASAYDNGTSFDWYSPENGYLISFMTVLPEQTYAYGAPRHLSKLRIFDFAFPEFAQIGMDAVYNSEIKRSASSINKEFELGIFGYQGRYYDYKCKQDEEHGQLRTTEDMYTFSRDYNVYDENSRPKLNYRFVHCHPSLDMFVVDDPSQDQFRYDVHHSVAASRALPVCGMSV